MKLPKVPKVIVIKVSAIGICGLVAVAIPHPGASACAQASVMEIACFLLRNKGKHK